MHDSLSVRKETESSLVKLRPMNHIITSVAVTDTATTGVPPLKDVNESEDEMGGGGQSGGLSDARVCPWVVHFTELSVEGQTGGFRCFY